MNSASFAEQEMGPEDGANNRFGVSPCPESNYKNHVLQCKSWQKTALYPDAIAEPAQTFSRLAFWT